MDAAACDCDSLHKAGRLTAKWDVVGQMSAWSGQVVYIAEATVMYWLATGCTRYTQLAYYIHISFFH